MAAGTPSETLAERLAVFASGVRYADMPREDVAAIKRLVLDTLGCALGAVGCEPVRLLAPLLRAPADDDDAATLIGTGQRVALADAILYNGALVRYLDFMDVYWARDICHPSENIPVALAAAQAGHHSGRALIEAIAVAYEAQVRLADAFSLEGIGLHHVSAAGFVTPLVFGKLWSLAARETAHAVALGGFRHLTAAALVQGRLSMAKAVGYALPSAECVASTRLAAAGFTGPLAVLESLGVRDLDLVPGTASARRVSLKQFPVQYTLQSPVQAALKLRELIGDNHDAIESITIEMQADALRRTADPAKFAPANRETADHSLPCCVAMALLDGRLTAKQFDSGGWQAPGVKALMAKIRCEPSQELADKFPGGRPARVTVRMAGGTQHVVIVEAPLGDASRPMDDAQLREKFLAQAVPVIGTAQAERAVDAILDLESISDVGDLCALLAQ
ncbi:MAG TPA: MmgE/PrpD family protein [Ramlibacter sp.]|nr:MmgE/PrpD family protein [Ramlibacter sp.]